MMRFDVITLFPDMFSAIRDEGVVARGLKKSLLEIHTWQLRDFADNKYRNVDEKPYGGGAGMVMQVKPIRSCIGQIKQKIPNTKVIYLSPQGQPLTHQLAHEISQLESVTLLCGRYEGVDERVIEHDVDMEISIIDSVSRQVPGVLGNAQSLNDSFAGDLLDYPHYTRPEVIDNQQVPAVLLSGHQANIDAWRADQAFKNTQKKRQDLIKK